MKNRGLSDANNVTAAVYWSEVSTLVTPNNWHLIGTTAPIAVPQGDTLAVAGPLTWIQANIPATGHYCFIGLASHPQDPAPPIPSPFDWNGFTNFIRNHNNVTWRNFNVVDQYNFGMLGRFNHSDLASLIAPRAFMVEMGDQDGVIVAPRSLVDREIDKVLEIYRKLGIPEKGQVSRFPGPHMIDGRGAFPFLDRFLRAQQ